MASSDVLVQRTIDSNLKYSLSKSKTKAELGVALTPIVQLCLSGKTKISDLENALGNLLNVLERDSPLVCWITYLISEANKTDGNLQQAEKLALESLSSREKVYGGESTEVIVCLDLLSNILLELQEYERACNCFTRSIQIKMSHGFALFSTVVEDTLEFCRSLKAGKQYTLGVKVMLLLKQLISAGNTQDDFSRDVASAKIYSALGELLGIENQYSQQAVVYEELLSLYKNSKHNFDSKEIISAHESIIQTYGKLQRYSFTRPHIDSLIKLVLKTAGVRSNESIQVFKIVGITLLQQADEDSSSRLCDRIDGVRYLLCAMLIKKELDGMIDDFEEKVGSNRKRSLREIVEEVFYNNKPLTKTEASSIFDTIFAKSTVDFLLDTEKCQNLFLKVIYPPFMAEDALSEKNETLPAKVGFLAKYGLMKSWTTRYFVLDRQTLYYYEFHNDPKPRGEYSILDFKSIEILPSEKKFKPYAHCFQLTSSKRTIILGTESEDVLKEWVGSLKKAKAYWEEWNNSSFLA